MKYLTGKIGHKMVVMLLTLALVSVVAMPATALHTEAQIGHSAASSDGKDVSICEIYLQGLKDGHTDGVYYWRGYSLEKRLKQHHSNDGQRLAYTDGYILGYILGELALWMPSVALSELCIFLSTLLTYTPHGVNISGK